MHNTSDEYLKKLQQASALSIEHSSLAHKIGVLKKRFEEVEEELDRVGFEAHQMSYQPFIGKYLKSTYSTMPDKIAYLHLTGFNEFGNVCGDLITEKIVEGEFMLLKGTTIGSKVEIWGEITKEEFLEVFEKRFNK